MLLVTELLHWWYTAGWRARVQSVANRFDGTIDYFSMGLLIKTLFSPYRQISAGRVDGPLEVKLRALVDKLFSRVIGAFIRLILLVIGSLTIAAQALFGLLTLLLWAFVPLLPIMGVFAMAQGWVF